MTSIALNNWALIYKIVMYHAVWCKFSQSQGHQSLISSDACPNDVSLYAWWKAAKQFKKYYADNKLSHWCQCQQNQTENSMYLFTTVGQT